MVQQRSRGLQVTLRDQKVVQSLFTSMVTEFFLHVNIYVYTHPLSVPRVQYNISPLPSFQQSNVVWSRYTTVQELFEGSKYCYL